MFKITPIGSCRITTPLRRGQSVHGFHLNMDRCYGYCHSPAEAVQMARFMQGTLDFPQDTWPLISRKHDLETIAAIPHAMSDLYVVELASAKEVTLGGVCVQLNYLNATFPEFFAETDRAHAFWELAGTDDEAKIAAFLDQHWSNTPRQLTQTQTLRKLKLRHVTRDSLRGDIKVLAEMLPDVLFVSHVDACKADGAPIKSRSAFIKMVAEEVQRAGCKFFNPTDLMNDYGQAAAIEDESAGLAHFTDAFADGMMHNWMRDVISPKTDDAVKAGDQKAIELHLAPQIAAACDSGHFVSALSRLKALPNDVATVEPLLREVAARQDKARAAFLAAPFKDQNPNNRLQRADIASRLGLFDEASKLIQISTAGSTEIPTHLVLQIADQAQRAGAFDAALELFFLAATRGVSRACQTLAELAIAQNADVLSWFDADKRGDFLSHLSPVRRVEILTLNNAALVEAVTADTTAAEVHDIVSHLATAYGIECAADVLTAWRERQGTDRIVDTALLSTLDTWVATALSFEERIDRIHGLKAVFRAAPRHKKARLAMQDIRTELALLIRAAGKGQDINFLDALSVEASALTRELPELDLWRARLRFALGEYAVALELGQAAAAHLPEKINIWVLLMRAATKGQYWAEAAGFARKVIDLACPKTEALKIEAEAVLRSETVGV